MKLSLRNKTLSVMSIVTILTMFSTTIALAAGLLNLPVSQVSATQNWLGASGVNGTVATTLSGINAGFDVSDGTYPGWCLEDNHRANAPAGTLVILFDSTDPSSIPGSYAGIPWDKVNYLLNHKIGSVVDVQQALWLLTGTFDNTFGPATATALAMVADANANGVGFIPGEGQVVAVILYGDGMGPDGYQDTIIEVKVPYTPPGGEGCTPGYWRNHPEDWAKTGYSWEADFDATFGVNFFNPNITLGQAIWLGGGGVKALARHGTAALLSAAHPDVNYPYTVDQVIAMVRAKNWAPLATANELGCSIP